MSERKPFILRIDPELYEALHRWADDELRSVNAQIEFVLRHAVAQAGRDDHRKKPPDERSKEPL